MFSWILKPSTRRKGFVLHGYQLLGWLFNLAFYSLAWYYTISIVVATPCCLVVLLLLMRVFRVLWFTDELRALEGQSSRPKGCVFFTFQIAREIIGLFLMQLPAGKCDLSPEKLMDANKLIYTQNHVIFVFLRPRGPILRSKRYRSP